MPDPVPVQPSPAEHGTVVDEADDPQLGMLAHRQGELLARDPGAVNDDVAALALPALVQIALEQRRKGEPASADEQEKHQRVEHGKGSRHVRYAQDQQRDGEDQRHEAAGRGELADRMAAAEPDDRPVDSIRQRRRQPHGEGKRNEDQDRRSIVQAALAQPESGDRRDRAQAEVERHDDCGARSGGQAD